MNTSATSVTSRHSDQNIQHGSKFEFVQKLLRSAAELLASKHLEDHFAYDSLLKPVHCNSIGRAA